MDMFHVGALSHCPLTKSSRHGPGDQFAFSFQVVVRETDLHTCDLHTHGVGGSQGLSSVTPVTASVVRVCAKPNWPDSRNSYLITYGESAHDTTTYQL